MKISSKNLYKGVYFLIFGIFAVRLLTENFHLTYSLNILMDFFAVFLLVLSIYLQRKNILTKKLYGAYGIVVFCLVVGIVSNVINGCSLYNLFSGWIIYLRIFIGFLLGVLIFKIKAYYRFFYYLDILMIVNSVVMTFQYFYMNLKQDKLGGLFGNTQGCNAVVNSLCCAYVLFAILEYILTKRNIKKIIVAVVITCYVGAISELTIIYFELAVMFLLTILFTKKAPFRISKKRLLLTVVGVLGVVLGIKVYLIAFPERAFLLNYNELLTYLGGGEKGSGVYQISRIRVFQQITNRFFDGLSSVLFGFGVGNCGIHSSFYAVYDSLLHYNYFSTSMTMLESGIMGVIANFTLMIGSLISSLEMLKNNKVTLPEKLLLHFSQIFSVIVLLNFFYNSSSRDLYTAYFYGILLGIPFAIKLRIKDKNQREAEIEGMI